MFPEWFFDCSSRERSLDNQARDDYPSSSGRYRDESDCRLPSYNELYELENPGQSSKQYRWIVDGASSQYPLVGGLNFSAWERNDPEGDVCFAAVSSSSRQTGVIVGRQSHDEYQEGDTQYMERDELSDRSEKFAPLIDLDDGEISHRHPPTHQPDEFGGPSSSSTLTPLSNCQGHSQSPAEDDQASDGRSASMVVYDTGRAPPLSEPDDQTTKRKFDDGDNDSFESLSGNSILPHWKRPRMGLPSLTRNDDMLYDDSQHNDDNIPDLVDSGEEWQGDSLTMDHSDPRGIQGHRFDLGDSACTERLTVFNGEYHNQRKGEDDGFHGEQFSEKSSQLEDILHDQQQNVPAPYEIGREDGNQYDVVSHERRPSEYTTYHGQQPIDNDIYHHPQSAYLAYRQHPSDDSHPSSAIEAEQWPSDELTIFDPSADWLGYIPSHISRQSSDHAIESEQSDESGIQRYTDTPYSSTGSQMTIEPTQTVQPIEASSHISPQVDLQTETRKRPAEEVSCAPSLRRAVS